MVGGGGREVDNGVWARNEASLSTAINDMNLTQEFDTEGSIACTSVIEYAHHRKWGCGNDGAHGLRGDS